MNNHKIEELLSLIETHWKKTPTLQLTEFLQLIATEANTKASLESVCDDVLMYQLKTRDIGKHEMIPGLAKDTEADFKTALLQARGILKDA